MVDDRRNTDEGEKPERRREPYRGRRPLDDPQTVLLKSRIAPDLLEQLEVVRRRRLTLSRGSIRPKKPAPEVKFDVIIEFNELFPGGARQAREIFFILADPDDLERTAEEFSHLWQLIPGHAEQLEFGRFRPETLRAIRVQKSKSRLTSTYAFASCSADTIKRLVSLQIKIPGADLRPEKAVGLIHRIWLDHELDRFVYESRRTIKADAAISAFACSGDGILWAVADTGIDGSHPHFRKHKTLELPAGIFHRDFTTLTDGEDLTEAQGKALRDEAGHGTHVAGIIAGETLSAPTAEEGHPQSIIVERDVRVDQQTVQTERIQVDRITGVAPKCKLLSLKVLAPNRKGNVSDLLAAIGYVQEINDNGRRIRIHGLNLSVGYPFDPQWFAPGQSALCVEVNRLVKSGVVVVAAAGNAGYGRISTHTARSEAAAFLCTIADPGNAEEAITVGSTHRDMPHTYGVSYFSSKGPTADGRPKPDIVAPGERIISCAANASTADEAVFREDSGTSMAAPHVSGAVAAFLSIRREFIGQPDRIKETFVGAATDIRRRVEFQGAGVLDLMRTLQSI